MNAKKLKFKKTLQKLFHRFTNYTKTQKLFTLFLFVFTFVILCFPIIKITGVVAADNVQIAVDTKSIWIFSFAYLKSFVIVGSSLLFLFGWNTSMKFKSFVVNGLGFRENEPMINFGFLWVIAAVFVSIIDTVGIVSDKAQIKFARGGKVIFFVLLVGIVISLIDVFKSASQNSQKTKILNIVDEEGEKKVENKRVMKHLFDED